MNWSLHITTDYLLKSMVQSGQRQLQLNLHASGTMKTSMVQNMFDANLNGNSAEQDIYHIQCANVNKMLRRARLNYYSEKITSCHRDPKNLFKIAKHLLEDPNECVLPVGKLSADLAQDFCDFFINKIETIRNDITSKSNVNNIMIGSDANIPLTVLRIGFRSCNDEWNLESDRSSPNKRVGPNTHMLAKVMLARTSANSYKDSQHIA